MAIASDYAELWAWLKGDTGFVDQSGNDRAITLPGGSANPTIVDGVANGHAVIDFNSASHQFLGLPTMAALTQGEVFLVFRLKAYPPATEPKTGMWNMDQSSENCHLTWTDKTIYDAWGSTVRKIVGVPAAGVDLSVGPHVYNVRSQAGLWVATLDGVELFRTTTNTVGFPSNPTLGSSQTNEWVDAQVPEWFMYSELRSDAERAALVATLLDTYSTPSNARVTVAGFSALASGPAPNPNARISVMGLSVLALRNGAPPAAGGWARAYLID